MKRARSPLAAVLVVPASVLVHLGLAALLGSLEPPGVPVPPARAHHDLVLEAAGRVIRPAQAAAERARLVEEARAARVAGTLNLGSFVLAANAIDAAEERVPFDLAGAGRAYVARVARLRELLAHGDPASAASVVFADLEYTGVPGGRMGDALLRGAGSCEPTSHLVAAALYDAGLGDAVAFRYYGGAIAGVTHLTAVVEREGVEIDLLSGRRSRPGGRRFVAADIIETYARAHGLAPRQAKSADAASASAAGSSLFEVPETRTLTAGYPPNADRFDSPLPLYGARAVAPPAAASPAGGARPGGDGAEVDDDPEACVMSVSLAMLDPPSAVTMTGGGPGPAVDLVRVPVEADLERLASLIVHVESTRSAALPGSAGELVVEGCLAALYDEAALGLSLGGHAEVARRATTESSAIRRRAAEKLRAVLSRPEADVAAFRREILLSSRGRAWVLLFLDGAEPLLEALANDAANTYSEVLLVAGLIVSPKTRDRALAHAAQMKVRRQVDVMHEVFRAHESARGGVHARGWASNYAVEVSAGAAEDARAFGRAYRVFRPLAWRLWESPAPPSDGVSALVAGLDAHPVTPEVTRALTSYYVRNFVGLYRTRPRGGEQIAELDRALRAGGLPGVAEAEDLALNPSELEALGLVR